ncbi:aryl hydrocarbon receptor-like isoform X2 [Echeneis naucrates]|uniref:aryl hydrocarbon receptor-like isoform X2 n=1 Tax=Echeneis naucrates TaxID=173247 RepID=UPI0011145E8A|nr:aryl hydrocarbon receptor-like isoform X2 [Echeneis naucrates]
MQGNGGLYAVKRRKKPVQKSAKPSPVKTNPSKRHRDRLNVELDRLTGLLPFSEDVRGRLDKLSVLRLSVGYLKVQSYFHALQKNVRSAPVVSANSRNGWSVSLDGISFSEGDFLLQALNGFVLVVTTDGTVFYASPTILDFLGFHQSDVVHQSVFDLVHMDDREMFKCQLHFALNPNDTGAHNSAQSINGKTPSSSQSLLPQYIPPENSSFLERSFCCRLRCLLDNTSGFLALTFNGRLKYLHLRENTGADGKPASPQLALFAIATPLQTPSVLEIRTKTLIFQTKHRLDFAPLGIDTRGKLVLGYTEIELVTPGSGYQFIHAADMMYCADNHLRMIKTGDSGMSIFRLLTKTGHWLWVQASARVVFKGGKPDFIIARQKALTNEEGEEHLRQRRQQLPFNLATGEGVLYDVSLDIFSFPGPPVPGVPGPAESTTEKPLNPTSLLGSFHQQDSSVYLQSANPGPQLPILSQTEDINCNLPQSAIEQAFLDSHALLSVPSQTRTPQKRAVTRDMMTSEAMIESLEQILGDIGDGGIKGLEVEQAELRDWQNTLLRMNKEQDGAVRELDDSLANDVFSYVEEALRRETGGYVLQGSDRVFRPLSSLHIHGEHPGFSNNGPQFQPVMDTKSNQSGFGNLTGGVGKSTGQKDASQVVSHRTPSALTPPQCRNAHQGSSNHHCGNEMSTQSCVTHPSWPPSMQNTHNIHSSHQSGSEAMDQSVQYSLNHAGPRPRGPSVWQQQEQLPQSFHHHTLSHSSLTPSGGSSAAQPFHPQSQRLSGSCMYDRREGHIPSAARIPTRQTAGSGRGVTGADANAAAFAPSHQLGASQGVTTSPHVAGCATAGTVGLGHLREDAAENRPLQSSFFCWNGNAQIPKIPLNSIMDPFTFSAFPSGSINLSQNSGP